MNRFGQKCSALLLALTLTAPTFAFADPGMEMNMNMETGAAMNGDEMATTNPAIDLRIALDEKLGEHAFLAIIAMQKGVDGKADFGDIAAALGKNTDDLSAAIASVYGDDAGKAFHTMWSDHIGFFVDYVKATATKDEAGRQAALEKLGKYKVDFANFLAGANPNLNANDLADGLQMHVDQLVKAFDSYVNKDYPTAYAGLREAYAHMFMTADALAGAIAVQFPDKFGHVAAEMPAGNLRSLLDEKLGEHAMLAVVAMQKGIDGAADFSDVAAALSANTDELSAAVASVYRDDAGKAFHTMWSSHIGFFVDYVKATATKDEAGRQAALEKLGKYRVDFANFLATANPNLNSNNLADGLQMHVNQLVSAFDSYVGKDYPTVYASLRESYAHMFMTGDALSAAIVKQFPDKFAGTPTMPPAAMIKVWMKIGSNILKINDETTTMDTMPNVQGEFTFIPLRFLSEGIGANVVWDGDTQTVVVKAGDTTATFWIGKDTIDVNGQSIPVGTPVFINSDGRTMVPLRFIASLLGWDVQWNESDWSILLTKSAS